MLRSRSAASKCYGPTGRATRSAWTSRIASTLGPIRLGLLAGQLRGPVAPWCARRPPAPAKSSSVVAGMSKRSTRPARPATPNRRRHRPAESNRRCPGSLTAPRSSSCSSPARRNGMNPLHLPPAGTLLGWVRSLASGSRPSRTCSSGVKQSIAPVTVAGRAGFHGFRFPHRVGRSRGRRRQHRGRSQTARAAVSAAMLSSSLFLIGTALRIGRSRSRVALSTRQSIISSLGEGTGKGLRNPLSRDPRNRKHHCNHRGTRPAASQRSGSAPPAWKLDHDLGPAADRLFRRPSRPAGARR
jgi:hypothetical protein